jgi:hypothetical protein
MSRSKSGVENNKQDELQKILGKESALLTELGNALLHFSRIDSHGNMINLTIKHNTGDEFTSVTLRSRKPIVTKRLQPGTNMKYLVKELNKLTEFGEIKLGIGEESNTLFLTEEQVHMLIAARNTTKVIGVSAGDGGGGGEKPSTVTLSNSIQQDGQVEPGKGSGHGSGK